MKKRYFISILAVFSSILSSYSFETRNLVGYVNTNLQFGNVVPGPQVPWGSVSPSPTTVGGIIDGYAIGQPIHGFAQTHVSGTGGRGEYGNFLVSPQVGTLIVDSAGHSSAKTNEICNACYYSVNLTRYNVKTEISATQNVSMYQFTFPASDSSHLFIDLCSNIPGDNPKKDATNKELASEGVANLDPTGKKITGYIRFARGGSVQVPYKIYFCAKFSKVPAGFGTNLNKTITDGSTITRVQNYADRIGAYFRFKTTQNEVIQMKMGVSFQSITNAEKFADTEVSGFDFNAVKTECENKWNRELSTVLIDGATEDQKKIFYTAMYHSMVSPHKRTGDNPYWTTTEPYYDDHYAGWDTWKTLWPLITLLRPSVSKDVMRSLVDRYNHNLTIRDIFCKGAETDYVQGGDVMTNVLVDAYMKGITGVDWENAFRAIKGMADGERNSDYIKGNRGITNGNYYSSRTLEFNYNDYCVAQMAKALGKQDLYNMYITRSMQWERMFNPQLTIDGYTGFIAGIDTAGNFTGGNFYEGGNWDYSYCVPHDFARIIQLMGGPTAYVNRLSWAIDNNKINFANEPSFMTVRSFNYALRPDLTSKYVRHVFKSGGGRGYTLAGYPGDEDGGAMSSWYVFSAMGFFPNSGQDVYLINGPLYPKTTIQLENGKNIVIEGVNASETNMYVQSLELNGQPYTKNWFTHKDIVNGATLKFTMGSTPSNWSSGSQPPPSLGSTGAPAPIPYPSSTETGPYLGTPWSIPGFIPAECFDKGGAGVGFSATTPIGRYDIYQAKFRFDGPQVTNSFSYVYPEPSMGPFYVGIGVGQWLAYTVNVKTTGKYHIVYHAYAAKDTPAVHIEIGNQKLPQMKLPVGRVAMYYDTLKNVDLTAGNYVMKIVGDRTSMALNSLNFIYAGSVPVVNKATLTNEPALLCKNNLGLNGKLFIKYTLPYDDKCRISLYSVNGKLIKTFVNENRKKGTYSITWNTNEKGNGTLNAGTYVIRMESSQFKKSQQIFTLR